MNTADHQQNPTSDWRKYPKGPNFLGIVIGSSILLLVLLVVAWFIIHADGRKLIPHGPNATPNALMQQRLPSAAIVSNA